MTPFEEAIFRSVYICRSTYTTQTDSRSVTTEQKISMVTQHKSERVNSSTAMESNEIDYSDPVLSLGIGVTLCWLVVKLVMKIKETKNSILTQRIPNQHIRTVALKRDVFIALTTILVVYIGSAIGIALVTQDMDWRMFAVITGLSRCEFFENSSC